LQVGEISKKNIALREPLVSDAVRIQALIQEVGQLDQNSTYLYLLLCTHFSQTCVLVESDSELAGFATGYIPPDQKETLFIWQIAVASTWQKKGYARQMILSILKRSICKNVSFIQATVGPENLSSRSLFASLAKKASVPFEITSHFQPQHFGDQVHEPEDLITVGPFHRKDLIALCEGE